MSSRDELQPSLFILKIYEKNEFQHASAFLRKKLIYYLINHIKFKFFTQKNEIIN
jgi:hypothetical protein